jgi:peptidoglycan/LPS O-acetylase OafA/YrhL
MLTRRLNYRPEVDGLRAIAILSVFAFHLNSEWLRGGFVGVDIFFVISGYLITSILLQDCEDNNFSLGKFYQRRIARLFPAFFTVAIATVAITAFVYLAQDFASVGATLVAASLSLANLKFMLQGNYFTVSPDAQPLLHYWSLSLEEQFYLLYPFMLFLIFKYMRRWLALIMTIAGLASYAAAVALTPRHPTWAFYLLPTRAWELCLGALVAVISRRDTRSKAALSPLPWVGIGLIGTSFLTIHEGADFPGWVAAVPAAGAAAVLSARHEARDWLQIALSSKSMVIIGKISYSLYLWHLPVFCVVDYAFYTESMLTRTTLKMCASIVLAVATHYLIETPARAYLNRPANRVVAYAFFVAMLAICVPLGLQIRKHHYINAGAADVRSGGLLFPGLAGSATVVLMGDSKGSMYGKTIKEICGELGYTLRVISVAGGDALPGRPDEPGSLWNASLAIVRASNPDYLVFSAAWTAQLKDKPERLAIALDNLSRTAKHIILLTEPPILPDNATREHIRNGGRGPFQEPHAEHSARLKINDYLRTFSGRGISVIDVTDHFERANGELIYADGQGRLLYHDAHHLSGYGSDRVREVLMNALSGRV